MKVNDIYLAFLSAFDSTDKDFGSFSRLLPISAETQGSRVE